MSCLMINAQQDFTFTHYVDKQLTFNPAFAGSQEDAVSLTALHRSQWVGFEGAPMTQSFTAHAPIPGKNIGLGLSLMNDKIGPMNDFGLGVDFAYKVRFQNQDFLSMGLKADFNFIKVGLTDLDLIEGADNVFAEDIRSGFLPNFGFGLFYQSKKYFVGLSIPRILNNGLDVTNPIGTNVKVAGNQGHYYLVGGYEFNLTRDGVFKMQPTTMVKVTAGAPIQMDLTANFTYQDKLHWGLSWRSGDAASALLGVCIIQDLLLSYSYNFSYTPIRHHNSGTHEILLQYNIGLKQKTSKASFQE